jgi:hypothetical protein
VPQVENPALPGGSFCSREPGRGSSKGVAAPGPRTRETAVEAEATQTKVAAEAEAGEARSPTPVRGGGKGVKRQ